MDEKHELFVVVTGNNGAGKSEFAGLLNEAFGWAVLRGEASDYVYLQDFLADMRSWSFHNQFQFILQKFKEHESIKTLAQPACQERSAYDCYEVFTRKLHDDGLLSSRDFQCLTDFYTLVSAYLPFPDLIIHLKAPIEVLHDRIRSRGRAIDRRITLSYLADLAERYDRWIQSIQSCPVLVLDTSHMDYVSNLQDREVVLTEIRRKVTQRRQTGGRRDDIQSARKATPPGDAM